MRVVCFEGNNVKILLFCSFHIVILLCVNKEIGVYDTIILILKFTQILIFRNFQKILMILKIYLIKNVLISGIYHLIVNFLGS